MVTSFLADSIEVLQVKQAAEARFGSKPNSPSDFAELSLYIKMATNKDISSDTLSRLWGYKKGYTRIRHSIIDLLNAYAHASEESGFILGAAINAENLKTGPKVRIAWLPDRVCTLEYLGNWRWRVEKISNGKLHVGDTFACRVIAQGQPMVVDDLYSNGMYYKAYIIGGSLIITISILFTFHLIGK